MKTYKKIIYFIALLATGLLGGSLSAEGSASLQSRMKVMLPIQVVETGMSQGFTVSNIVTKNVPKGSAPIYSLVSGSGGEDNSKFTIEGNYLRLNFKPDFENPIDVGAKTGDNSYSVRIKSKIGSAEVEDYFLIYVLPDNIVLDDKYKCKGYGWSQNIGWLSLNCTDLNICKYSDYGTSYNTSGKVTGFAWAPNVGWLNHTPAGGDGFTRIANNSFEGKSAFNAGLIDRSDGWSGFLSFGGVAGGHQYGVKKSSDGWLSGFAWGGEVVGWLGFPKEGMARCSNMLISFTTDKEKGLTPNTEIKAGENAVLKWKTQDAVSCRALNGEGTTWTNNPNKPVSYSNEWKVETVARLTKNTKFSLECTDAAGKKEVRNLFVFVKYPRPEIRFWATSPNIPYDTKAQLNWEVKNVSECKASGDWSGNKNTVLGTHREYTTKLKDKPTYTFILDCKSNLPEQYGTGWFRQYATVDIGNLEIDIKALRSPVPFHYPAEIQMNADFATKCKRTYSLVEGTKLLVDKSGNSFTKGVYGVPNRYSELWTSESLKEKSVHRFKLECEGKFGRKKTKEIDLKVINIPGYKEI